MSKFIYAITNYLINIDILINIFQNTETKIEITINVFRYENKQAFPFFLSEYRCKDDITLLLLKNE